MNGATPSLSVERIRELLIPFDAEVSLDLAEKLKTYLDLLLRWNARTNLTAIREPEQIVTRHFGESLFTAGQLPTDGGDLLDLGSGAGFPGLPIALAKPAWRVTLAESQGKKAAFLLEAVRALMVPVEVWSKRVELLPESRQFQVVTMRAVDESERALVEARKRVRVGGCLLHLTSGESQAQGGIAVPGGNRRVLRRETF